MIDIIIIILLEEKITMIIMINHIIMRSILIIITIQGILSYLILSYRNRYYNRKYANSNSRYKNHDQMKKRSFRRKERSYSSSRRSYRRKDSNSSKRRSYRRKEKKHYSSESSYSKSYRSYRKEKKREKESKDAGHFDYEIGDVINNKYKITNFLCDGTFGRVLECIKCNEELLINKNKKYAVKIIRPVKRYIESAEIEVDILKEIKNKIMVSGSSNPNYCITLEEDFKFSDSNGEYMALVFEKLGLSLYEYIKMNNYLGKLI